ncbi:MAG: tetratricopeptide repeat protein [Armatimonadota bacterium]
MDNADQALLLARRYIDIEQPARALETLDKLSNAPMQNPDYWYLRGRALYELTRYEEAINMLQRGLGQRPDYTPLLYMMCNCQDNTGNLAEAERAILAALRLAPEEPAFLCRYAYLVAKAGQMDKADRLVDEAARISPQDPMVLHARASLSLLRGNDKEAASHSREMLAKDPDNPVGHYMYGLSQYNSGKVSNAARHFGTAVRYDPKDQDTARIARQSRIASHWLLWPLRPLYKLGAAYAWIAAISTVFVLCIIGQYRIAGYVCKIYLVFCLYSWIMPPILRWWYRQR